MRPIVRRFDIEVGRCSQCQRREEGGQSAQTSDSLGAAGVQLGRGVVALVVELHAEMGVPLARVRPPAADEVRVARDPGGLTYLHRVARDAARTYTALCAEVRKCAGGHAGWKALGGWAPSATGCGPSSPRRQRSTPFARGRGFDDAGTVLGADFDGLLVRDGWASFVAAGAPRCTKAV